MKESWKLLNKAGARLYGIVIVFSIVKELVLIPLLGLIWKLTLMTTPDGFISNANIGRTLLKSPWVIIIGVVLLGIFLLFSMWQISATMLGIGYAYEGKSPRIINLLQISVREVVNATKLKNAPLLLYTAIILPMTNIFQASEMIGAFVVPEYIMDFIEAKLWLHALYFIVIVVATYFALRLFFVLPAFFLKEKDYKKASAESFELTKKGTLKNGVKLIIYGLVESVRLAIIPLILMITACSVAYICVSDKAYASDLFSSYVLEVTPEIVNTFFGVLVYLSSMCYVVNAYYNRCAANNTEATINLPELSRESRYNISGRVTQVGLSLVGTVIIAGGYLLLISLVGADPEIADSLIYEPVVIAHKGYSSIAPENTMDAFELADKTQNANLIELDVWSSKDGIPVVIHNETINAATGQSGKIYDYTYEQLQSIHAPYAMNPQDFPDARIPSLEEVLAAYANTTPIIIEIKGYKQDEQLPAKIVALMEKYNCTDTSMIHSGNYQALKAAKMCNPAIQCGLIQAIVTGDCYNLPYADFFSVEHSFVNDNMIDQLHRNGKKIFVWTVNYDESVSALRAYKVDGFITDYPDKIAEEISKKIDPFEEMANTIAAEDLDSNEAISQFEEGDY